MVHILLICNVHTVCHTLPHFADSLLTAVKCLLTKMGVCKDNIVQLWLCTVLL
jgi:hypothetical protein